MTSKLKNALLLGGKKELPAGYTRLAYLENSLGPCGIQVPCPEFYKSVFDVQVIGDEQKSVDGILIGFGGAQTRYGIIRAGEVVDGETRWTAWGGTSIVVDITVRHTVIHMMDNTYVIGTIYYRVLIPVKEIDEETGEETVSYLKTWRDIYAYGNTYYQPATFYQYFYNLPTRIWGATLSSVTGENKKQLVPAMAPDGTMGLFDVLQGGFHTNVGSNTFVAGIETRKQLYSLLAKLSDLTGQETGVLTIRLDAALQTDELRALIDARAEAKNWEITEAV